VQAFYASRGPGGGGAAPAPALEAVSSLAPLVQRALAHLLDHLKPFGLEAVLRLGASFAPWEGAQEMRLSANTLRHVRSGGCVWGRGGRRGAVGQQHSCQAACKSPIAFLWVSTFSKLLVVLCRQLEIFRCQDGGPKGTLLSVMDQTKVSEPNTA
jgi:hypothetical protein